MRTPDDCQQAFGVFNNIEFISNFQAIQASPLAIATPFTSWINRASVLMLMLMFAIFECSSVFSGPQVGVKNTFGYIRPIANSNDLMATETQFNIQNEMMNNFSRQNATAPTTEQLHNLLIQPNHTSDGRCLIFV